jgi:hypothetical protein
MASESAVSRGLVATYRFDKQFSGAPADADEHERA